MKISLFKLYGGGFVANNEIYCNLPAIYCNASNVGIEAIKLVILERERISITIDLRKGYEEMGQINLSLADLGFEQDMTELKLYEARLTGRGV